MFGMSVFSTLLYTHESILENIFFGTKSSTEFITSWLIKGFVKKPYDIIVYLP